MANELALTGGKTTALTISDLSGTALWKRLDREADDSKWLARQVASDPVLLQSAHEHLNRLEALAAPVGKGEAGAMHIFEAMQPLLIAYGRPKRADAELKAWWSLYYDALAMQPRVALDAAVKDYIATSTYATVPTPGVLNRLADPHAALVRRVAYRAKLVCMMPTKVKPQVSDAEHAEIAEGLKQLSARLSGRGMPDAARPTRTPQQAAAALRATVG